MGGSDQSVYARLGKTYTFQPGYSVRVSGGLAGLTPFVSYDGLSAHLGLSWSPLDWLSVSGLWIETEEVGVSLACGWNALTASVDK